MTTRNQNINLDELKSFESLVDDWWNPHGKLRTLHVINPVRMRYIENAVVLAGKKVLDIGCGGGILCESMAEKSAHVTGLDASKASIQAATDHSKLNDLNIEYNICTVEEYADQAQRQFDVITCMELLEHIPDQASILNSVSRLLKQGGQLFLSTINRTMISYLSTIIGAEYILNLIPRGTHHYSQFITPAELCNELISSGFSIVDISGIRYLPIINYAFLTSDPAVNYLIHAQLAD